MFCEAITAFGECAIFKFVTTESPYMYIYRLGTVPGAQNPSENGWNRMDFGSKLHCRFRGRPELSRQGR